MKFATKRRIVEALLYTGKNGPALAAFFNTLGADCDERNPKNDEVGKAPFACMYNDTRLKIAPGTYILIEDGKLSLVAQHLFEEQFEAV